MNSSTSKHTKKGAPKKQRTKKNGFSLEGARYIRDEVRGVSLQERAVLYDANVRANLRHEFFVRVDTWSRDLGIGESTLRGIVAKLVDKGLLEKYRQFKKSNRYRVLPNSPKWRKNADAYRQKPSSAQRQNTSSAQRQNPSSAQRQNPSGHKTSSVKDILTKEENLDLDIESGHGPNSVDSISGEIFEKGHHRPEDNICSAEPPTITEKYDEYHHGEGEEEAPYVERVSPEASKLVENYRKQCSGSQKSRIAFYFRLGRLHFPKARCFRPKTPLNDYEIRYLNRFFVDFGEISCELLAVAFREWANPTKLFGGYEGNLDLKDIFEMRIDYLVVWAEEADPHRLIELESGKKLHPIDYAEHLHDRFVEADIDQREWCPSISADGQEVTYPPSGATPEYAPEQLGLGL